MDTNGRDADIAVVGMSCRLPGARDVAEYWRNLREGVESISFFSQAELLEEGIPPEILRDPAFVGAHGAVPDAYAFDAGFFGASHREAEVMDPQHRVFLECAWSALEDAGYAPGRLTDPVGVYAGSGFSPYLARVSAHPELVEAVGGDFLMFVNGKDFLTTRVSFKLGLRGPSVAVQTACSTSLVAIHLACQSLLGHECDLALAGGVTIADQVTGYEHREGGILSPDGHCRAFDARAAGTVSGSGAGVVVLKRLADALRDGDAIHAVVRGSAIGNDGAGRISFNAPGVEGQVQVIAEALAAAGVDPSEIGYVEAHGTGTPLGDPIEVRALTEVFGAAGDGRRVALGAVKTNIGHLDTAAGVAGFIKTVLMLKHRVLPPTLHFQEANPETGLDDSPFYVNTALRAWESDGPRRAGVSSFGMGGTNAHVVLEEAPEIARPDDPEDAAHLIVLSAKTGAALERMRRNLADHLAAHPDLPLADVAYTLQEGRAAHPHRWAAAARDADEARAALDGQASRRPVSRRAADRPPPVAFLFPGQGTQYAGMARELYDLQPVFRREIDRCAELLAPLLDTDLRAALFPARGEEEAADALLRQTRYTQPALFAVEYALAALWASWGVRPESMLGHSIGEYVAATLAGVFSLDDALRLVAARGRLMQELPAGAMLAVPLAEEDVRPLLNGRLSLAAVNGAAHCVVSGDAEGVDEVERLLASREVQARRLHTSHAFHSAAMDPILDAFAAEVRRARPRAPRIPFLSNVTGDWITAEQAADPGYWVRHLRETVRFADGVGRLLQDPARVLLEVGPGDTLGTFARRHGSGGGGRTIVASLPRADRRDASDVTVLEAAGSLWTAGVEIDWAALRGGAPRRRVPLPTYPFERDVYRVPPPPASAAVSVAPATIADAPPHACELPASASASASGDAGEAADAPDRLARITAGVADIFARMLGTEPAALDADGSFLELGADSFLLMQASQRVERTFGVRVPFRQLIDGVSTIGRLAAHLDREAAADVALPPAATGSAPSPGPAETATTVASTARVTGGDEPGLREIVARLVAVEKELEVLRGGASRRDSESLPVQPGRNGGAPAEPVSTAAAERSEGAAGTSRPASHGPHRPVRQTLGQGGGFNERQARHFEELVARYTARTRSSKEYAAKHRRTLADNRASLNFRMATKELLYPIVGHRSEGARLWDVDGNEYVDFTMGFGVHFFGHRPPFIEQAVEEQRRQGFHLGPQSELAGPAAELLCELTGMERATFCNTGSEAVMTALRIARAVTGRDRVVLFEGSYHGCFDGILARPAGSGAGRPSLPVAPGTPARMVEDVVVLPYGARESIEWLQANGSDVAAVLVEPVQSRDPELHPREFLRELRSLTRRSGSVLVFDEMITGLRLGLRGAQGFYDVDADLATYGKVIGGGQPLGVVAGRAELMDAIDGGAWSYGDDSFPAADQTFFAGTFCKHPAAMAAACAVLRHLREQGPALYDELHARAGRLVAALRAVLAEEEVPVRVLHCGSLFRFVFREGDPFVDLLFYHMLERGIYIWEGRGCFLSTAHTDDDCAAMVRALRESIHALRDGGFLPERPGPGGNGGAPADAPAYAGAAVVPAGLKLFSAPEARPLGRASSFPLTPPQRQVWVHARLGDDASRAYNEQMVLALRGPLDADALREALADVAAHHEALRTVFDPSGETQHVLAALPDPLPLTVDEAAVVGAGPERLAQALEEVARGVFDLAAGPLFRVHVHALGPELHVLQLVIHHIVADGLSIPLLRRDLETAYAARREGRAPRLPEAMQFSEYARLLAAEAERCADFEAEWLAGFQDAAPLLLPYDRPRSRVPTRRAGTEAWTLGTPLVSRLREAARREGCTLFMTLFGGLLAVLHRLSGQDDVVVGVPSAGRPFAGSDSLVGHCVDTFPVRSRIAEGTRVRDYLRDVRGWLLDAYEHETFSLALLQEKLQTARAPSLPPLVSVVFNLEPGGAGDDDGGAQTFAGLQVEAMGAPGGFAKIDLAIDVVETGGGIDLNCTFDAGLFDGGTVRRTLGYLQRVLEQVAEGADVRLSELDLLGDAERRLVLEAWNRTEAGLPSCCVHELFADQAARTPDAEALRFRGQGMTYRALDEASNRLAHHLAARGVGAESIAGIVAERAPETVVAILAVLKAGGAYLPLDPAYPADRLRFMLADSGARIVIAPAGIPDSLSGFDGDLLDPRAEAAEIAARPADSPRVAVSADALAYVIYTSGSTGLPKGVMVSHRGVPNLARAQIERFGIDSSSRVLQFASFSFDAAVSEVFTALLSGATLVLASRQELLPGPDLLDTLRRERVSVATLPPSVLAVLPPDGLPELRTVVSAGEAADAAAVERWSAGRRFINAYGPTETTVCATSAACEPDGRIPPIGGPLDNVRVYVRDAVGRPSPVGVPGELFVGGAGVARGYLGRPALTADRFVPDPFGPAGGRLYRTGDRVRWREIPYEAAAACATGDHSRTDALTHSRTRGVLEFIGRADEQVKIRGFRIEPGEIEAALRRHAAVADCAVVAREDAPGDRRLVAYVVRADEGGAVLWPSIGEHFVYDELIYHGLSHDAVRNERYLRALRRHAPGKVVLDVGTGSQAVLARLAVEAGARHVYAVEVLESAATAARERVRALGLEDRITVIHGNARTVRLPEPADVCVSEIVEAVAGGEGAAVILNEARGLLAPGAVMIPGRAETRVAAVTLPEEIRERPAFSPVAADYVRRIFAEQGRPFDLRLCIRNFPAGNLLSTAATFEELDFSAGPVAAEYTRREEVVIQRAGRLDGLLLWLRMELAEGEALDILEDDTDWMPAYFPLFDPGVDVRPGDRLRLEAWAALPGDGVAPDYGVRGVLARAGGGELPFEFVSRHHGGELGATPFYRRLFDGGQAAVREDTGGALPAALREHLAEGLPEYMVPAAFVVIDRLPLTPNGKLDRAALPAPALASSEDAHAAPRTPVEEVLGEVWAELLALDRVGVEDDFFDLGGHSLLATWMAARVREVLGVELPVNAVFEAPTLGQLAAAVDALRRAGLPQLPPVVPVARTAPPPLSFAQERLWFLDRLQPGSAFYNIPAALRLSGALDVRALERGFGEIVRRHEVLRTTFREVDGRPVQVIAPSSPFTLPVEDLSALSQAERAAEVRRLAAAEAARPFDLAAGPLFRATLLRLAGDNHVLLLSMHHAVSDAWSMGVLFRELAALYGAYREGRPSPLAEPPVQYADFAVWQREQLEGDVLDRQLAYWKERLAGAPALLELPTDHPRPARQTHRGAYEAVELSRELLERLRTLGRQEGATLYMVLLGAFQVLLSKYGGDDVVVGTPISGRTRREVEGLIGFFVNTLVLRTDLSGNPDFREVLRRVREITLGAYEHQDLPFERLVAELQPERSLAHAPLFQVMFTVQEAGGRPAELPGVRMEGVEVEVEMTKFDLTLSLFADAQGIGGSLRYATDLFERGTVRRMLRHLERVLEQVSADPDACLASLVLMGDEERRRVVEEWNRTDAEYPAESCVHHLFQEQVAATPDAVALVFGERSLTYRQLDERANRLAHRLAGMGVGPEVRVALCLEPCVESIVSLLGVMKAGGAYVPLDPASPPERLRYMLDDAGARLVLASPALAAAFDGSVPVVEVAEDAFAEGSAPAPRGGAEPRNLAYVIYTSGSTGRPKGVLIEHRGVCNTIHAFSRVYDITPGARVLLFAPLHFDASVLDVFTALTTGATLVVATREEMMPGEALVGLLDRQRVTHAKFTPSALAATPWAELPALRAVMSGGEACGAEVVARWAPGRRFFNGYGPTETSVRVTVIETADGTRPPPIGRAVANTRIYVLDTSGLPVPVGVPGELYIGGAGVGRGYQGRPGRTAETFVPDPFSGDAGARLYRTGDRVRWAADGALEFVGRIDDQVKIRGLRVEPGEIQAALRRHPGVADCAVVAREDASGERRLVAYVVGTADAEALRAHLRQSLPEYMVPGAFIPLDQLPLTPAGKVDRGALPAPSDAAAADVDEAPRTPVEEVLAGIWAEVLGVRRVGVNRGFFDMGGHSLLVARVISRVRELFGIELPVRALFEGPTVARLARAVEEARQPALPPVVPVRRGPTLPPSFAQERLWFIDRMEGGSAFYNVPAALRLAGALDAAALERALGEVVRRHEALRTTFREREGEGVQVIAPFVGFALPVDDLAGLGAEERGAEVRRRAEDHAARPFDLAAGPLLRARLLRLGDEEHVLLLCIHHIVTDGWSMGILFRELSALYAAFREGRQSPLPEPAVQYADYAVWQRNQLGGEALDRQLAYWKERLAGAPVLLALPADRPRPAVRTYRGAREPLDLPRDLRERLEALGRREGATLYMVLLAAFQVLLSKYSGSEDVVTGSPIAGRTRREVEGLIGFFVNTLVLRTDLSGNPSFGEVLRRVRGVTLEAYENQEVPFERLVAELRPERSLSHAPLFQVMFSLQNADPAGDALPGLRVESVEAGLDIAKFDLSLSLGAHPDGISGALEYSTDLFEQGTVARMLGHLRRVLEQVAEDAERRLSGLELLADAERRRVVEEWNRTDGADRAEFLVHQQFQAQAARTPGATAVVFEDGSLTYRALDEASSRLAHHLAGRGVGPESIVGIVAERAPETVVAILAVLKAGGAYLPLDPAYPADRLRFMLADSGARTVITPAGIPDSLSGFDGDLLDPRAEAAEIAARPADSPRVAVSADALAYVIYTSGSTGLPKGVMVPHRGVPNLARAQIERFGIDSSSRVLQFASFSFDAAVSELFTALLSGATLVLASREELLLDGGLMETLRRERITVATIPPSVLAILPDEDLPDLRTVVSAGEAVDARIVQRWSAGRRFINAYGPTETTVCATSGVCEPDGRIPPIGGPLDGMRACVLDATGRPSPVGVPGELFVGGVGVARGYLGRPALTAERFVPDPFGPAGGRLYRTGDRVRWREIADEGADGCAAADPSRTDALTHSRTRGVLEFIGRVDEQVKIRGFRIEPGEIEAALRRHPGVTACAVVAREDVAGDRRLVAYVTGQPDGGELRSHLRGSLPEHMVPAAFVVLDALPLTANGKVDRAALPAPAGREPGERHVAPRTPVEEALAGIWTEILRVDRVGVTDSFFDLGGHSLLVMRLLAGVRAAFGVEISIRAVFSAPTLEALAGEIERKVREQVLALPEEEVERRVALDADAELSPARRALLAASLSGRGGAPAPIPRAREGDVPLSFAQERLWFLDRLGQGGSAYNIPTALRLRGALDPAALERSLGQIVRRHETLRTTFRDVDGVPVQVIAPFRGFTLPVEDLSALEDAEREAQTRRLASADAVQPFDLTAGPLFRARLLRLGDAEHVLLLCVHHIASDGWSMRVLFHELWTLYGAYRSGRESPLPQPPVTYADFAVWQREEWSGEAEARQLAYWRDRLAGAPELLELPTDRPRPPAPSFRGGCVPVRVPRQVLERLRELGRGEGATLYMVVLAAFQVLLSRYAGCDDVVVGTPVAGRMRKEVEGLIGLFMNTLVLRTDLSGDPGFRETVERVRETVLGAYEHQEVPFERVVAELRPERSLSHSALFQVLFQLDDDGEAPSGEPGLAVEGVETERDAAKFDLTLALAAHAHGIDGVLEYSTDLFERGTALRMAEHFVRVLEQVAADADRRLSRLELVDAAERARLAEWNRTEAPYPADRCIHQLFEAQVERTPHAPAVVCGGVSLSYRELDERANRLAHRLVRLGVGPEVRVGLLVERGPEMMVALLAVLKAGGAYVPLDRAYPAERLRYMLDDSGVAVLLTQESFRALVSVPAEVRLLSVDGSGEEIARESAEPVRSGVTSENLCYVIYTSGSTGRPKGVAMHHRGVCNYLQWGIGAYGADRGSGAPVFTSMAVDLTTTNLLPLFAGLPVRLLSEESPVEALADALRERPGFGLIKITPTHLSLLTPLLTPEEAREAAHTLVIGADFLPAEPTVWWQDHAPGVRLMNEYGPTETVVGCSAYELPVARHRHGPVPVGGPIQNLAFHVLDARLQQVPVGLPGELYIGGAGVARGYLGRPGLSAAKFVPDPFAGGGARMYRTGDRARWLEGGNLLILGRTDHQVKIRGYRVELGEIEAALRRHPAVSGCLVVVREDRPGDRRLVAYMVGEGGTEPLRQHLRQSLPEYMVPGAFVRLDSLPETSTGKLDPRALPPPEQAGEDAELDEPRSFVEAQLIQVWEEMLGVELIGPTRDFFELGGNSLLALRLFAQVNRRLGCDLPLSTLFAAPTVRGMAEAIEAQRRSRPGPPAAVIPLQPNGSLPPLFCVHPADRDVMAYVNLVRHLGADQPVFGVRDVGEDPARPLTRIASEHVRAVRAVQPEGPYHLLGWSFGGFLAYEMAIQLERAGQEVAFVGLLDTMSPVLAGEWPWSGELDVLVAVAGEVAAQMRRPFSIQREDLEGLAPDEQLRRVAEALQAQGVAPPGFDAAALGGQCRLIRDRTRSRAGYVPGRFSGGLTLFRASEVSERYETFLAPRPDEEKHALGWSHLAAGPVEVHRVPGSHVTIGSEPHVRVLARHLRDSLSAARSRHGGAGAARES